MKYLPLFHHFKAIYQFPKHTILLVKIVANASLRVEKNETTHAFDLTKNIRFNRVIA